MSLLSEQQANAFLTPLQRKFTTFLVDGRESNARFASFILNCVCVAQRKTKIIDTDAFYASSVDRLANLLPESCLESTILQIPLDDLPTRASILSSCFAVEEKQVIIIDDLNTVYHLLSASAQGSGMRRLRTIIAMLSFLGRANDFTIVSTAYQRVAESSGGRRPSETRSLAYLGDLSVLVSFRESELRFTCVKGSAWIGNTFFVRLQAL